MNLVYNNNLIINISRSYSVQILCNVHNRVKLKILTVYPWLKIYVIVAIFIRLYLGL